MIDNRQTWLAQVFDREAGYSNNPDDNGGPTNMGITQATLASWRGVKVTAEDVQALTKDEASAIYLARYWQAVRGDQLPSGVDIYVADTAVLQGPGMAARLLQQVVHTESDGFIGPKTIEACRAQKPLTVLLNMHDARIEHLESLDDWDIFGKGWTRRCRLVLAVARSKAESKPMLTEAASSRTVQAATVGTVAGGFALWPWLQQNLPDLMTSLSHYAQGLPEQLQSADELYRGGDLQGHIAAAIQVGTLLFVAWRRVRDWRKGER